jgi:tetratricopeptide (TPR) repeat protein
VANYRVAQLNEIPAVECPCGMSRRAFAAPDNPVARFCLGNTLAAQSRFEEARPEFVEAARLEPTRDEYRYALGRTLRKLKRDVEAAAAQISYDSHKIDGVIQRDQIEALQRSPLMTWATSLKVSGSGAGRTLTATFNLSSGSPEP